MGKRKMWKENLPWIKQTTPFLLDTKEIVIPQEYHVLIGLRCAGK